jgi:hypothetical protein
MRRTPGRRAHFHLDPWLKRFVEVSNRATFHISPQALHRQYADTSAFSVAVVTLVEWQNGQDAGASGNATAC